MADTFEALQTSGCDAAGYRLSGAGEWPRFCGVDLGSGWRLLLVFVDQDEIILLELAPHDNESDPYRMLAELLDLPENPAHGGGSASRIPCCDDGDPPVIDVDLRDRIERAVRRR